MKSKSLRISDKSLDQSTSGGLDQFARKADRLAEKKAKQAEKAEKAEAALQPPMNASDWADADIAANLQSTTIDFLDGTKKIAVNSDSMGGIEILVKLAESGEIDAKNVDIIDVTDKFLKAIAAAPKENLRQSGKVLFHASVLLRMKAEALLAAAKEEIEPMDDFLDFDDESGLIYDSRRQVVGRQITLLDLEKALVRRTNTQRNRQRKVTLEQLIDALKDAEKLEKERSNKQPKARIELSGYHEVHEYDDILELAHDEDIEKTIDRIEQILIEYTTTGELIPLLRLIILLGGKGDWVDTFLAVLFLSNTGKITLEQPEFYGPLFVFRGDGKNAETIPEGSSNIFAQEYPSISPQASQKQ
ncbi:MAG: segregation/condensation protein A [Candidatus Obscuribacterales bacterium]|nr:segregation/condensation protein A [Candidatus Obscuribacterales bacterium]